MNNLLSCCGLTDSRMSASDTDLPVSKKMFKQKGFQPILKCNKLDRTGKRKLQQIAIETNSML